MRRLLVTVLIVVAVPPLLLIALAGLGAVPGGVEVLLTYAVAGVAAALYWRSRTPSRPRRESVGRD